MTKHTFSSMTASMLVDGCRCVDGNSWYGSTLSFQQCGGQAGPELDGWENDSRIFSSKLRPRLPIRRPGERGEERRCRDGAMALWWSLPCLVLHERCTCFSTPYSSSIICRFIAAVSRRERATLYSEIRCTRTSIFFYSGWTGWGLCTIVRAFCVGSSYLMKH